MKNSPQSGIYDIFRRIDRFPVEFRKEMAVAYAACSRVTDIEAWFRRLQELAVAKEKGAASYRQIEDHVFELKVINYLQCSFPRASLTYEPSGIRAGGPKCDLEAMGSERAYLIEIKSFHPEARYKQIPAKFIAADNLLVMDEESYHSYQATRGHLIDVSYATESKIANYAAGPVTALAVPDGFELDREDFRDFVYFYRHGRPRNDDPLGPMTEYNRRRPFAGSISEFWAMPFPQWSFRCSDNERPTAVGPTRRDDRPVTI